MNLKFNFKNMTTISINILEKDYKYLSDDNIFQAVITETVFDYIEKKQDLETKNKLSQNAYFANLNNKLEEKLWNL